MTRRQHNCWQANLAARGQGGGYTLRQSSYKRTNGQDKCWRSTVSYLLECKKEENYWWSSQTTEVSTNMALLSTGHMSMVPEFFFYQFVKDCKLQ